MTLAKQLKLLQTILMFIIYTDFVRSASDIECEISHFLSILKIATIQSFQILEAMRLNRNACGKVALNNPDNITRLVENNKHVVNKREKL